MWGAPRRTAHGVRPDRARIRVCVGGREPARWGVGYLGSADSPYREHEYISGRSRPAPCRGVDRPGAGWSRLAQGQAVMRAAEQAAPAPAALESTTQPRRACLGRGAREVLCESPVREFGPAGRAARGWTSHLGSRRTTDGLADWLRLDYLCSF